MLPGVAKDRLASLSIEEVCFVVEHASSDILEKELQRRRSYKDNALLEVGAIINKIRKENVVCM